MTHTVQMAWAQLLSVREQQVALKEKENELVGQLKGMVPEGKVVDGIRHVVVETSNVSYAKAVKKALQILTPRGRAILNDAVLESTINRLTHRIQEAAEPR